MIQAVPQIQRNPVSAHETSIHYGYVAFHDIHLTKEHIVQPEQSPYRHVLPKRELIPFTNIDVSEIDERLVQNPPKVRAGENPKPPVKIVPKSAYVCAEQMEISYAAWGFQILRPLTGISEDRAFRIFQTVQPFAYKLRDIQQALGSADERIDATEAYPVEYEGESITLRPLSAEDKEIARKILPQIVASADLAMELAVKKQQDTLVSMTKAFAGGDGKVAPDPLDKIIAAELGTKLPQHVAAEAVETAKTDSGTALKLKELELKERELALKEQELELMRKQDNREKMAQVRAARKNEHSGE